MMHCCYCYELAEIKDCLADVLIYNCTNCIHTQTQTHTGREKCIINNTSANTIFPIFVFCRFIYHYITHSHIQIHTHSECTYKVIYCINQMHKYTVVLASEWYWTYFLMNWQPILFVSSQCVCNIFMLLQQFSTITNVCLSILVCKHVIFLFFFFFCALLFLFFLLHIIITLRCSMKLLDVIALWLCCYKLFSYFAFKEKVWMNMLHFYILSIVYFSVFFFFFVNSFVVVSLSYSYHLLRISSYGIFLSDLDTYLICNFDICTLLLLSVNTVGE